VVRNVVTAARFSALVVGALIAIFADDRVSHAHALLALVRCSARVAVFAFLAVQGLH